METIDRVDYAALSRSVDECERFARDCLKEVLRNNPAPLLSAATANTKTRKSMRQEFRIVSLPLSHASNSGFNVCSHSTKQCRELCIADSGLSQVYGSINDSRNRKTVFLFQHRDAFIRQYVGEIERERRSAENVGATLLIRSNTFSDCPWHTARFGMVPQLFLLHYGEHAGGAIFYDYTKDHARVFESPPNWHLTGSWSENPTHQERCYDILMRGRNICVPFATRGSHAGNAALRQSIPTTFRLLGSEFRCFDADESDLRLHSLDPGPDSRGYGAVGCLRFKSATVSRRNWGIENPGFVVVQD